MYKEKEMIEKLRKFAIKIGRKPVCKDVCKENGLPNAMTYITRFGSFDNALKLSCQKYALKIDYNDDGLLKSLLCYCNELGRRPTQKEINNNKKIASEHVYNNRFGSVIKAVKIVKPEFVIEIEYTEKELLSDLKEFTKKLGRKPTNSEIDKNKFIAHSSTYVSKFGGVKKALNVVRPDLTDKKDYSSEGYLKSLKKLCDELGRRPQKQEIIDCDYTPSANTYRRRFGSVKNAFLKIIPKYAEIYGESTYRNKDWLFDQHYKKGKTARDIAKGINVKYCTITKWMKFHGLKRLYVESTRQKQRETAIRVLKNGKNKDTKIEILFETCLKKYNINYEKQWVYKLGIADFYLPDFNAIIECDGIYWHNYPIGKPNDKTQTEYLKSKGYNVFRFWETEINKDVESCLNKIIK